MHFGWFCYKMLPNLADIISGTKHDRDKPTSSTAKNGYQWDITMLEEPHKTTITIGGQSGGSSPTTFKYGSAPHD